MKNDDVPTTTSSLPPPITGYYSSPSDVVRVASADPMTKPSKTMLVATISTTLYSKCGKSVLRCSSSSSNTQHSHHIKQRMIRISIIFISLLIIATLGRLYKSTETFNQFELPGGNRIKTAVSSHTTTNNKTATDAATALPTILPYDELIHLSIEEYVIRKLPLLLNGNQNKNKKQIEALQKNLRFAYRNVPEMLARSQRFPSIQQRVKLYMSNWYIPPCNNDARIIYQYSTTTAMNGTQELTTILLTVHEISQPLVVDDNTDSKYGKHKRKAIQKLPEPQQPRVFSINSHFDGTHDESFDEVHYMDRQWFEQNCTHKYCQDMVEFLLPALDRIQQDSNDGIHNDYRIVPILYQFGDMHQTRATQFHEHNHTYANRVRYPNLPVIQKVRVSKSPSVLFDITDDTKFQCYHNHERRVSVTSLASATATDDTFLINNNMIPFGSAHYEPIIFKLKTHRHYGGIYKVADADTVPWILKKNSAIFRGSLTGLYPNNMKVSDVEKLTVYDRCRLLPRCWFTVAHATSKLVDSKLTDPYTESKLIPRVIKIPPNQLSFDLYGSRMSMDELLQYKALILLEGNDVSSGLKWALFSNSIVLMPPPTLTSWAMEEMLQPWVHYVPINVYTKNATNNPDTAITFTDAEEKMQWVIDNDDKAQEIVKASTLWIADLVLHPDVLHDEMSIFDEMARRYLTHFV